MPDSGSIVGRGGIVLTITAPANPPRKTLLSLRYEIDADGIRFYNPSASKDAVRLFALVETVEPIAKTQTVTVEGSGHLSLVALPASPRDAFYNVSLTYQNNQYTLRVVQAEPFAIGANTAFQNLDLRFTETQSGTSLTVKGGVTAVLFGQTFSLVGALQNSALVFGYQKSATASPLAIDTLGNLDLDTLEVSAGYDRWAGLQALYAFDEGSGNTLYDTSGNNALNLTINDPTLIKWVPGGIAVPASTQDLNANPLIRSGKPATNLIKACKASNEITIEAWIKPANLTQFGPARIVELSEDNRVRNLTLGQGFIASPEDGSPAADLGTPDFCVVRLRSDGHDTGQPELISIAGTLTTELTYLVLTHDAAGQTHLYINGVEVLAYRNDQDLPSDPGNAGSLGNTLEGSFSNWDENYELVLGNALGKNRPWAGELHQIAIYDRAIPAAEISQNYSPSIRAVGTLALTNVPAPLSGAIAVELVVSTAATVLTQQQTKTLFITSELQFSQVQLVWQKARNAPFTLSGRVLAKLFGQELALAAALVDRNNQSFLVLSTSGDQEITLRKLGTLTFSEWALQFNRSLPTPAWDIVTNSQSRFTVIPAPLDGPFETTLTIEQGRLWLTVNATDPLAVVKYLTFERVNLGFTQNLTDWDTRGEVQAQLLGKPLLLSPLFVVEATKVFSLHQAAAQTITLIDTPATLDVSSFKLRSQETPTGFVWQVQSTSNFAVPGFAFSGSLVLSEVTASSERRLFLTTTDKPLMQLPLVAGAATPILTVRSTIGRIAIDQTGNDGNLDPAGWVLTAQADLYFDRINQTLIAAFRADREGISLTCDRQADAFTFDLPSPTFNGQTAQLGQVVFDLSDFALMPGSAPTIDAHLTAHLPAQLDAVLGAARSHNRFFADAVDLKLEIRSSQGLALNVLTAFVQPEWGHVSEDAGSRWLSLNLPNLVQARMQLPELKFTGRGFTATGRFEQVRSLNLPLALFQYLLKTYSLNAVADALPKTVPMQPFNVLSATDFNVDALLNWIEDHGKAEGAEFPRATFEQTLNSLATRLDQLPETFSQYLSTTPPKAGNYQLDITDDAGAAIELFTDVPVQCLVLAAAPLGGLFGVTLRRVTIAQILGGLLYAPKVDATVDYFDFLALETALSQSADSPLPAARSLKQQLTANDLVTIVNYQPSQPLAVPLFYRDLGFEFLGLEGLGFGIHGQFDRQPLTHPQFVNLIGALANFLSDAGAVLSDDPFATRNLPLQFGIDRAVSQLPQYAAGTPPKRLGPSAETWADTARFRNALNALKRGRIGGLLRLLPLAKRSGAIVANFGPMQADANWAVVSTQEFPATLFTSGLNKLALITADQRNGLSNLMQFAPNRVRTVEDDTAIAFLVGNWTVDRRLDLKLCLGLAQSISRGYGTGFSIAGLLAKDDVPDFIDVTAQGQIVVNPKNRQPVQLNGTSTLRILNEPIFTGDIQLAGDRFFLNGKLSLFPRWSPLQITSDTQIEITPEARVHSVNPATATLPDVALLDPVVAIENGRITLSGLWLGQQAAFTGIRRSNQFILQGDMPFVLPFSLTLGPIFDPRTGVKIADQVSVCQGVDCRQLMNVTVQVELSAAGFLARINSTFTWEDETFTVQNVVIPEFTIFAPPPTRNALLNLIIEQLKANANQIFADRFRNEFDYFLAKERPLIVYGKSATPRTTIQTVLPTLFSADLTTPIVAGSQTVDIFRLEKLPAGYTLTLTPATRQKDIDDAYETFLTNLEIQSNPPLIAGAANLIKARIAERLPMPIDHVLYYHYGFQSGQYLDLQAGMRLRVDQQAFQYVPDNTLENGFISSGTVYYQINSYLRTLLDGTTQVLLGFDPFLSQLQTVVNASQLGVGSTINLLQVGYRFPYYRLVYPSQITSLAAGGGAVGAERDRIALIIGAASLADLKTATNQVLANGRVSSANTRVVSFFFRGRATVIPEISVFVQEQPVYVPVGTTLRQIIERYATIPTAALQGQHLQFQTSKVRRLVHEGIDSVPTYKFINLDYQQYANGMDVYDLPAVKGDRFYF